MIATRWLLWMILWLMLARFERMDDPKSALAVFNLLAAGWCLMEYWKALRKEKQK